MQQDKQSGEVVSSCWQVFLEFAKRQVVDDGDSETDFDDLATLRTKLTSAINDFPLTEVQIESEHNQFDQASSHQIKPNAGKLNTDPTVQVRSHRDDSDRDESVEFETDQVTSDPTSSNHVVGETHRDVDGLQETKL